MKRSIRRKRGVEIGSSSVPIKRGEEHQPSRPTVSRRTRPIAGTHRTRTGARTSAPAMAPAKTGHTRTVTRPHGARAGARASAGSPIMPVARTVTVPWTAPIPPGTPAITSPAHVSGATASLTGTLAEIATSRSHTVTRSASSLTEGGIQSGIRIGTLGQCARSFCRTVRGIGGGAPSQERKANGDTNQQLQTFSGH
jgi:hypothetical protein